jgi:pimeloyl-ACP methyl ester carboxylesterase
MCIENLQSGPRGEEAHLAFVVYNPKPRLPLINCPTLVLSGRDDAFISHLENVKEMIPGAESFIIEGPRSSDVTREMSLEFAGAVLKFVGQP